MTPLTSVNRIGVGLDRPECVLSTADGSFYVSHRGRGATWIAPDGQQTILAEDTLVGDMPITPNGIALRQDGTLLLANISDAGGILELDPEGCRPLFSEINGKPFPPTNFVTIDEEDRVWFSVSSRLSPRHLAYRRDVANGYVGVIEQGVVRIIADGLSYTNEIRPDLEEGWLYVSETFANRVTRYRLANDLSVRSQEIFSKLPDGAFVDGIILDSEDGLIATCIVSNEVYRLTAGEGRELILSERDDDWIAEVLAALDSRTMGRPHFDRSPTRVLRNVSSAAFYGPELDNLAFGSLLGQELITMKAPIPGRQPLHWNVSPLDW